MVREGRCKKIPKGNWSEHNWATTIRGKDLWSAGNLKPTLPTFLFLKFF